MLSGKTVLKGKMAIWKSWKVSSKTNRTPSKSLVIEIKYSDGCGLLAGLTEFGGNWILELPHWFASVVFLSTFSKILPKRSLENLTSDDLKSFKLLLCVMTA